MKVWKKMEQCQFAWKIWEYIVKICEHVGNILIEHITWGYLF